MVNNIHIVGTLTQFNHLHANVYSGILEISRSSEAIDQVYFTTINPGMTVQSKYDIKGEIHTLNLSQEEADKKRHKKITFVKALSVSEVELSSKDINEVLLGGYLAKRELVRKTPLGRTIQDIIIAVPGEKKKSYYVNSIIWGTDTEILKKCDIGQKLLVTGRLQSRNYEKNGMIHTVNELSCSGILFDEAKI